MKRLASISLMLLSLNVLALPPRTADMVNELILKQSDSDFSDAITAMGSYSVLTFRGVALKDLSAKDQEKCAPAGTQSKSSAYLEVSAKDYKGKVISKKYFRASGSASSINICR